MTSLTEGNLSQLVKKQDRNQMKKGAPINILMNGNMSNNIRAFCLKLVSIKIWKTRPLKNDQYKVSCFKLFQHCTLVLTTTQIRFGRLNWIGKRKSLKCGRNHGKTKRAARRTAKVKKRIVINEKQKKNYYRIFSKNKKWRTGVIRYLLFCLWRI